MVIYFRWHPWSAKSANFKSLFKSQGSPSLYTMVDMWNLTIKSVLAPALLLDSIEIVFTNRLNNLHLCLIGFAVDLLQSWLKICFTKTKIDHANVKYWHNIMSFQCCPPFWDSVPALKQLWVNIAYFSGHHITSNGLNNNFISTVHLLCSEKSKYSICLLK